MLSDTGRAASVRQAKAYAKKHNIPFIEGRQIMEALADGK
jgi:3,4-dihydroxy-2-butanone 4-phosphate synthase